MTGTPAFIPCDNNAAQYLGMSVETLRRTYGHLIPGALDAAAKAVGGK